MLVLNTTKKIYNCFEIVSTLRFTSYSIVRNCSNACTCDTINFFVILSETLGLLNFSVFLYLAGISRRFYCSTVCNTQRANTHKGYSYSSLTASYLPFGKNFPNKTKTRSVERNSSSKRHSLLKIPICG